VSGLRLPLITWRSLVPSGGDVRRVHPPQLRSPAKWAKVPIEEIGTFWLSMQNDTGNILREVPHTPRLRSISYPKGTPIVAVDSKPPCLGTWHYGTTGWSGASALNSSFSFPRSTWMVSPSWNSPPRILTASGSCSSRWMARLSGRAP